MFAQNIISPEELKSTASFVMLNQLLNSPVRTGKMQKFIAKRPKWERSRMRHFCHMLETTIASSKQKPEKGSGSRFIETYKELYKDYMPEEADYG